MGTVAACPGAGRGCKWTDYHDRMRLITRGGYD